MTVHLEKRGNRIEVRAQEPLPGFRTAFPGAYETRDGVWTVPLSLEMCQLLRQKYGTRLEVGSELQRWALHSRSMRDYLGDLAEASDTRLTVLPKAAPKLARAMRKRTYQRVGAKFLAEAGRGLVADDPGLGKTLIAMGGILEGEVTGPYLVVAPKTAADPVWRREIMRWLPNKHRAVILPETRDQRERKIRLSRFDDNTWLIVHPEIVMVQAHWVCHECGERTVEGSRQKKALQCGHTRVPRKTVTELTPSYKWLFDVEWGAIIVDESHESLIKRSGVNTQRRRGLEMLRVRDDGIRIAMSGTPYESRPHQLWGTLNWLDPGKYSAYHRWAELFWQKGGYTGHEIGEFRQDREEMLWDSLSDIAIRRTKAEVAKDLPPKLYVGTPLTEGDESSPTGVWLPMTAKQEQAYRDMEKTSVTELESGRLEATTALAELTRLKQLACAYGDIETRMVKASCYAYLKKHYVPKKYRTVCADCERHGFHQEARYKYKPGLPSNKFTWTMEALEEWGFPKNPLTKVVIVSHLTGMLHMFRAGIEKHFRTKDNNRLTCEITGFTPGRERRSIIEAFNRREKDSPQIILLNVKAGGTAITLDTADRMIFISETRIPDQQAQAEDRIHRISNPRQCLYYYLRSQGTVDVGTALNNQEMDRHSHRLLDGRRGIEYLRHVIDLSHAA